MQITVYFYLTGSKTRTTFSDHDHGDIEFLNPILKALNLRLLWYRFILILSVCIGIISPSTLCVLCHAQTPIQLHEGKKKRNQALSSLPLSVHSLAFVTEQPQILN